MKTTSIWIVLILSVLTTVAITHTEYAVDRSQSGVALLVRTTGIVLFCLLLTVVARIKLKPVNILITVLLTVYFLALNLEYLTPTVVLGATMIFFGSTLGSHLGQRSNVLKEPIALLALRYALLIQVFGFLLSIIILVTTGQTPDLHGILFPFSEARIAVMQGYTRLGGFQNEPGTYSNLIYVIVLMRTLLRRSLISTLDLLGILSTLATFSAWSALGAFFYLAGFTLELIVTKLSAKPILQMALLLFVYIISIAAVPILLPTVFSSDYYDYLFRRFDFFDGVGSASFKYEAAYEYWNSISIKSFFGKGMRESYCEACPSVQDLGVLPNLAYHFGFGIVIPLLLFAARRIYINMGASCLIATIPFFFLKFFYYDFLVWFAIGVAVSLPSGHSKSQAAYRAQSTPHRRLMQRELKTNSHS